MRLIGVLPEESQAQRFSNFLTKEKVDNHIEPSQSPDSKKIAFAIWVLEEDQIDKALGFFEEFQKNPMDQKYNVQLPKTPSESPPPTLQQDVDESPPAKPKIRYTFTMTGIFLLMCVFVYFLNSFQELRMNSQRGIKQNYLFTPIQRALMYEFPTMFVLLENFIEKERLDLSAPQQPLPPELNAKVEQIQLSNPYWKGAYQLVLQRISDRVTVDDSAPLFENIRKGQVWRLFTPVILHRDLLHILFNMIWLWVLGKQLDMKLKKWQFLLLVLIVALVSNTAQYLMSGPLFMGFSGVITGMAGFIWMRQRVAPWEGYSIHRSTFLFLGFFILIMFILQSVSFIFEAINGKGFSVSIANTAHIVGALIGILLAKMPWMAWRPK